MSTPRVLFVDDDQNLLDASRRHLGRRFDLVTSDRPLVALEQLRAGPPFDVIVADMQMPVMSGLEFLQLARAEFPDTVRIMFTGQSTMQTAMDAVNEGAVFRFIAKPCPVRNLRQAIEAGVEHARLRAAERELLEGTLRGSVKVLTDILGLVNPVAFGRATRVQHLAIRLAQRIPGTEPWRMEVAAMLSQIGCVAAPSSAPESIGDAVASEEQRQAQARLAQDLVARIPRLQRVAEIIGQQAARFDGGPLHPEARVLRVALAHDEAVQAGQTPASALAELRKQHGAFDPAVLDSLATELGERSVHRKALLPLNQLAPGMILDADVLEADGRLLVVAGVEVGEPLLAILATRRAVSGIREPIAVRLVSGSPAAPLRADAERSS